MEVLRLMGVPCIEVRNLRDLAKVDRLIIPGGESTVMAKFLERTGVGVEIKKRVAKTSKHSLVVFGTCAGAIVIARKATGKNAPRPLGLIDIEIDRNAYGTQIDSFEATLKICGIKQPVPVAFIRAPKITRTGKRVEVLASYNGDPVLVRQGRVLAATFHTEIRGDWRLHEMFLTF